MKNKNNGFTYFINAWKEIKYLDLLKWAILGSLFTGVLFLLIGLISESITNPFIGYLFKLIFSNLILVPIILYAYKIIDKRSISKILENISALYIWMLPAIFLSCLAGISMIFISNIYLYYSILLITSLYLILSIFVPFFIFENKDLSKSISLSVKDFFNSINIIIPVIILDFIILLGLAKLIDLGIYESFKYSASLGLILSTFIALSKPLIYALPLFNLLHVIKKIKDEKKIEEEIVSNKVGDII